MTLMQTSWWRICLLWSSVAQLAIALDYGTLPNTEFPNVGQHGPTVESQRYILRPKTNQSNLSISLDTPTAAFLLTPNTVEMSQLLKNGATKPLKEVAHQENKEAVNLYSLASMPIGLIPLKAYTEENNPWNAIVNQPQSPLILKAYVSPLTVKSGQPITIHAQILDQKPTKNTEIIAMSNGQTVTLKSIGQNRFEGTMLAPSSNKPLDWLIELRAVGERFDKRSFIREAMLQALVVNPESGFQKVVMNPQGDLALQLKPAKGLYRIEVIYGSPNEATAWARELVTLDGNTKTIKIPKPPTQLAFKQALVKLLSMDRLSLEDEVLVQTMK